MPTLSDLPQSIRQEILHHLADVSSNHRYASVSKEWQQAFEPRTFASLRLATNDFPKFRDFVDGKRQGYVRNITLFISLPTYSNRLHRGEENEEEQTGNTRLFTEAVHRCFRVLHHWKLAEGHRDGIHLMLDISSPSDESSTSWRSGQPMTTMRSRATTLQIDIKDSALPQVQAVTSLTCLGRHIELSSVLLLMSRLNGLRKLDIELEHDTKDPRDIQQRRQFASGLGEYASDVSIINLRAPKMQLKSHTEVSRDSRSTFHSLFRQFTQQCLSVSFDDCIDARHFLEPFRAGDQGTEPRERWQHLQKLDIKSTWMMRRPYQRVNSRSHAYGQIHEMLLLVGRAIRFMPVLHDVGMRLYVLGEGGLERITLNYRVSASNKQANLSVRGIQPSHAAIEAWKTSLGESRGLELSMDVDTTSAR